MTTIVGTSSHALADSKQRKGEEQAASDAAPSRAPSWLSVPQPSACRSMTLRLHAPSLFWIRLRDRKAASPPEDDDDCKSHVQHHTVHHALLLHKAAPS